MERLKKIRVELNKTQDEFAVLLGISRNYVHLLESGKKPISRKVSKKLDSLEKEFSLFDGEKNNLVKETPSPYKTGMALESIDDDMDRVMELFLNGLCPVAEGNTSLLRLMETVLGDARIKTDLRNRAARVILAAIKREKPAESSAPAYRIIPEKKLGPDEAEKQAEEAGFNRQLAAWKKFIKKGTPGSGDLKPEGTL